MVIDSFGPSKTVTMNIANRQPVAFPMDMQSIHEVPVPFNFAEKSIVHEIGLDLP